MRADFIKLCRIATDRLFENRKALRRVSVRIGFWPEGMVIYAFIAARNDAELEANRPYVIPWHDLEHIKEETLLRIVDSVCERARKALRGAA